MRSSSFEDWIGRVERLATMNADVAAAALSGVDEAARASARAGGSPSGQPWDPTKEGGPALEGAANAISVRANGTKIVVSVVAPYVFHNFGAGGSSTTKEAERQRDRSRSRQAKTGVSSKFHSPRRQIIPDAGDAIPEAMKTAIAKASADVLGKAVD